MSTGYYANSLISTLTMFLVFELVFQLTIVSVFNQLHTENGMDYVVYVELSHSNAASSAVSHLVGPHG